VRDLEAHGPDPDLVAVGQLFVLERDTRRAMNEDGGPHGLGQVAVTGDVVGVGVGFEDMADREALLGGEAEVLGNAVTAGVDDERSPGLATADQVREAARLFVEDLLEYHRRLFYVREPRPL